MIKSSIIALAAVAAIGSMAAPAFAISSAANSSGGAGVFGDGSAEYREFMADTILTRLQQSGVPATSVEEWGSLVRAFVTQPDGTEAMQFFAPDTLKPVAL
ncbi:MAG TPA: hypothetical protein VL133_00030 [Devosia sp.]|nr:hypothetical protein [Devosia sp.]